MRRPFTTCVPMLLVVALAPAALFAQTPAPAAQTPAPAAPPATEPKLAFSAPAGLLLIQIKPDSTAVFEELLGKLRAGLEKSTDAALKEQFTAVRRPRSRVEGAPGLEGGGVRDKRA